MLDLVPLARSRRVMADRNGHPEFVRQFLQVKLPRPGPAAVTSSGIGADQDSLCPLLPFASSQLPPPPDAFHCEFRRVIRHPDVDHRPVFSDLVCPVGNRFTLSQGWEIVNVDSVGLSLWSPRSAPVFEGSH